MNATVLGGGERLSKENAYLRFKIIEPFLKKEKKLKEIEEEQNISYATLKRWVQAYKKNGISGLDKKTREDKNSFRTVNHDELEKIKKIWFETSETNISKLYERLKSDLSISYATFYRIVTNIDEFFSASTIANLDKIKKENECYLLLEFPIYILVTEEESKERKVPKLLLILDVATLEPINFMLSDTLFNSNILFDFIRETIIKVSLKNGKFTLPKEILVESSNINNKPLLKKIYHELQLKISEHYIENVEIKKFIELLQKDTLIHYASKNSHMTFIELLEFFNSYLYLSNSQFSFSINYKLVDELNYIRKLDVFLNSSTRKINDSKIRFKNEQYFNPIFKEYNSSVVEIKYSLLTQQIIYTFKDGNYLAPGYKL